MNDAPVTTPVTLAPIAEDSGPRLITQAQLLANASDVEGDLLTVTGLAISAGAGTLVDNGNGTWTYTPALNDDTAVSFSYTVSDGNGGSVAGSATLDITPVNDAPVITSNGGGSTALASVAENTSAVSTVTATDIEGDAIQYSIAGGADAARFQIDSVTGVLTFVAAPNFESAADLDRDNVYEVVLQAADGQGGAATQLLRIAVTNVNENPTAVTDQIVTAAGQAIVVTETTLLANDSDVDGDTLRVISVSAPTSGTLLRTASGDFLYTPAAGFVGADSFTYTVADAGGLTATAQVSIAVAITQPESDPFSNIPGAAPAPQANSPASAPPRAADTGTGAAAAAAAGTAATGGAPDASLLAGEPEAVRPPTVMAASDLANFIRDIERERLADVRQWAESGEFAAKFAIDQLLGANGRLVFGLLRSLAENGTSDDLRRSISVFGEAFSDLENDMASGNRQVAQVVIGSSVAVTAGVVAWLLRGGALLASLLSALPAWSTFDPIPIIGRRRERRKDKGPVTIDDVGEKAVARILRPDPSLTQSPRH